MPGYSARTLPKLDRPHFRELLKRPCGFLAVLSAFTWQNVPEFDAGNSNSFQIELFFDGRIRLSYLKVDAIFGLAGLSRGLGVPAGFDESDFSHYDPCFKGLLVVAPAVVNEGDGVLINAGQISLPIPRATNLTVSLQSSNTVAIVVPASVEILAGQTNAFFNITVIDDALLLHVKGC